MPVAIGPEPGPPAGQARANGPSEGELYGDLAPWFHLLTPPEEYADEAALQPRAPARAASTGRSRRCSSSGRAAATSASHLQRSMRAHADRPVAGRCSRSARRINPECEHLVGDMRTLRLGRTFDAVLVHDAICYMTTEADLRAAMATAFEHLRPGGAGRARARLTSARRSRPEPTTVGRTDRRRATAGQAAPCATSNGRPIPDPSDTTYQVDYAILTRDEPTARSRFATTSTSRALFLARHGSSCWPKSASSHAPSRMPRAGSCSSLGARPAEPLGGSAAGLLPRHAAVR